MSKTLMEVDLMKHATPVKRKRVKEKKVVVADPEPVLLWKTQRKRNLELKNKLLQLKK